MVLLEQQYTVAAGNRFGHKTLFTQGTERTARTLQTQHAVPTCNRTMFQFEPGVVATVLERCGDRCSFYFVMFVVCISATEPGVAESGEWIAILAAQIQAAGIQTDKWNGMIIMIVIAMRVIMMIMLVVLVVMIVTAAMQMCAMRMATFVFVTVSRQAIFAVCLGVGNACI